MTHVAGTIQRKLHLSQSYQGTVTDIEVIDVGDVSSRSEAYDAVENYVGMPDGDDGEKPIRGVSVHMIPLDFDHTDDLKVFRFLIVATGIIEDA